MPNLQAPCGTMLHQPFNELILRDKTDRGRVPLFMSGGQPGTADLTGPWAEFSNLNSLLQRKTLVLPVQNKLLA